MIIINNVTYSYNKQFNALKNINLKVNKGEAVAFIGPNGSGKSTLMKLINGLIFPDTGSYCFDGTAITSKKLQDETILKSFHKRIGFVFQNSDVQLFCSNVYDEIAFGLQQMGFDDNVVKKRIEDVLDMLKINDIKDRQPYHLSGGEKRKVAIASILVMNPDVLVLDEPMNGLDPKTKRFLRNLLIDLNKAGKTILCSTHDFEYIKDVFKRAVVFSGDHTIIRDGNYSEIINDEKFLYENNII